MSNGAVLCCAAWVCCDEPDQVRKALAEALMSDLWDVKLGDGKATTPATLAMSHAEQIAGWVLDHFDLVPKGVGKVIADAYRPLFEHAAKDAARKRKAEIYRGADEPA